MKRIFLVSVILAIVIAAGLLSYFYYLFNEINATAHSIYEPLADVPEPAPTSAPVQESKSTSSLRSQHPMLSQAIDPLSSTTSVNTKGNTKANTVEGGVGDKATVNKVKMITMNLSDNSAAKASDQTAKINRLKPFSLLFLGVDKRDGDVGRSDSIIVFGVNPERKSLLIFNIPRDTRTEIVGHNTVDKINHAYAFGGIPMAVNTVEHFLGIPIDYYVQVDMEGFAQIINILGGVRVNNAFEFSYEGQEFPKGPLSLDGNSALLYSRMRYDDPHGDIGRNERQRQIVQDLIHRSESIATLSKLPDILKQIEADTKTNLTLSDMMELNKSYKPNMQTIETDEVQGTGERIQHIYYYKVSQTERDRIGSKLKEQLQ